MQLASIGVTLAFAVIGGLITGYIIHIDWIFSILKDHELFDDSEFFAGLEDEEGDSPVTGQLNISSVEQTFATELNKQDILNGDYGGKISLDDPSSYHPAMASARRVLGEGVPPLQQLPGGFGDQEQQPGHLSYYA